MLFAHGIRFLAAGALFSVLAAPITSRAQAPAATPAPSATPSPAPTPTATPAATIGGDFTAYYFHTYQVNATGALDTPNGIDLSNRSDISNLLLNVTGGIGKLRANATVGQYAFPTVGVAFNPDSQNGANTMLYTALPIYALQYVFDSHVSLGAGSFAALLGQESPFTYQNLNVQRGLGWAIEPTISRGVQAAYSNGPWSLTAQENDAYYSGKNRAFEGLIGWSPSANTNLQFAAIIPGSNVPPNPTVAIGNKAEYDLMFTRQIGKLQLLPYLLWVNSPASSSLGYTSGESARAAVLIANWTFSTPWSAALRYENVHNGSASGATSPNADLIGYGPGSGAQTLTITPTWRFGYNGVLRVEYSAVWLSWFTPGLGFGPNGTGSTQNRLGLEFGVMH